jgi:prepilin-type N-terminal cleavage/methylation domain-containing protein
MKSMANRTNKRGFTLIELLVVVAIIGLLASITFFSIEGVRSKSRDSRRVADIKSIKEALAMYQDSFQSFPIYDGYITGSDTLSVVLVGNGFIKATPTDPINAEREGVTYKYYYQSVQGKTYLIEYYLETDSIQGKSAGLNSEMP